MEKAEPRSRSEEEIAGYREVLSMIHENLNFVKAMRSYGMEYTEFIFPLFLYICTLFVEDSDDSIALYVDIP